jgi:glycosyltransferase involved in cell wall biosynthesis
VGVNLLWLVPGVVGGSEESTLASLRAIRDLAPEDLELHLFVLEPFARAHPDVAAAFATSVMPLSGRSKAARVSGEASWLARRTRALELVHHAGGTAPPVRSVPYVLTIHDLQPLERRATHGRLKRAYLGAVVPRSVRAARRVAVPSEFVRRTVLTRVDVDPERVVVIPHGIDTSAAPSPVDEVAGRYGIDGPVVLYPAITYPHKNHALLVDAFALVLQGHPDALLVLTGGRGACEVALERQITRLGLSSRVRRTGRIPAADVAALYQLATVVAVPSRYEGFGLPAVEAMAHARPLVAAATSALPEVVGDAGILVDPDDVEGWARAISSLLDDADERARMAEAGRIRAGEFTWEANAAALLDLYRGALAGP